MIVTLTEIDELGVRNRKTSDIMTASMMSFPYYDDILIPEEILEGLVEGKEETEMKKWRYEKKEWWQGRWEIYLVILGASLAFWLF